MSGVACHHRPWTAHTEGLRRACNDITTFGQHTWSKDAGHGMPSSPLESTKGRTVSGKACHHSPWTAHTVERHRVWHSIIDLGQHTGSNNVGRGKPSYTLDGKYGRTTLGVDAIIAFKLANTVGWRRAWHAIISFGRQTRSNDVGGGMPSPPLNSTHSRMGSGVACHHLLWAAQTVGRLRMWHYITALGQHTRSNDVCHGMTSRPLDYTHDQTNSGVA